MTSIRLSSAARADFVEIRKYSNEQFSAEVADSYFIGFDEVFDLLRRHPQSGAVRPDLGLHIRCAIHKKHKILYTIDGDTVVILRIIHHARNAKRELGEASLGAIK